MGMSVSPARTPVQKVTSSPLSLSCEAHLWAGGEGLNRGCRVLMQEPFPLLLQPWQLRPAPQPLHCPLNGQPCVVSP